MKIRPSKLDGFENYPELPESIETFSPESRLRPVFVLKSQSARKKTHKGSEKLRDVYTCHRRHFRFVFQILLSFC